MEAAKQEVIWLNGQRLSDPKWPKELIDVQLWWKESADAYGDRGSAVLGAGFEFEYQGRPYFMPPTSSWQGSSSWEAFVSQVKEKLVAIGAKAIHYHWGRMD